MVNFKLVLFMKFIMELNLGEGNKVFSLLYLNKQILNHFELHGDKAWFEDSIM